ncbi:MAG: TonB-linked SusC/RagA family outer membrane protein [Saprospiraceae bacterium]|jgi:TonB-linked SusC/RagA family outer membrane protein
MNQKLCKHLFLLLGLLFATQAIAQSPISGTVSDEGGETLIGVNILINGTTNGTISDIDGKYTLNVSPDDVLTFSYTGYGTQIIPVGSQSTIDVAMKIEGTALDEIVVTGYGTQRKATLTGSVASIGGADLEKSISPNLGTALAGKVAGLYIDTQSGQPGAESQGIRVRGTNTFNNTSALVVVDGIPDRAGGLARINPADIESISVLKDASAAIYGARAANGVILVTTKRGKAGKPKIQLSSSFGVQNFTSTPEMLKGAEYMDLVNLLNVYKLPTDEWQAANAVRGTPFTRPNGEILNPTYPTDRIQNTAAGEDPWNYPDTDWFDAVSRKNTPTSRHNLQMSGGTDDLNYLASLGYLTQGTNFKNAPKGFSQYDLRLNMDAKINDHLKLDVGLYTRQENNTTATRPNVLGDLIRQYPWFPAYWPTGEFGPDIENGNNPAIRVTDGPGSTVSGRNFVQSNIGLTLDVPGVEGLQLRANASYDKMNYDWRSWERPWTLYTWDGVNKSSEGLTAAQRGPGDPSLTQDHTTRTDITATLLATYEKNVGDNFFKVLGGITREESDQSYSRAFKRFFLSNELDQLSFGGNDGQYSNGSGVETARLNYYGRLNYSFKDKYLVEALFRYDGSYLFPEQNRYGFFPGVSAGWVASEEDFFKESVPFFDFFKVRGSWGKVGNDNVDPYQFLASYSFSATGLGDVITTAYETKVANPNITWETEQKINFGFDAEILNSSVSIGFDVFKNKRKDILSLPNKTLPSYSGITPPAQNIGEFENKGYEVSLGYNGRSLSGLTYRFTFNFSSSSNKLLFIDEPALADRPWQRETGGEIGRPLLYQFDGVFRSQSEIESETLDYSGVTSLLKPGDAKVVDISGDGKIGPEDRQRTGGSAFADTQLGFNTALSFKNFDLNMFWAGAMGGYNGYEWSFMSGTLANVQRDVAERAWSIDNPDAPFPRLADRGDQWYSGQTDYALLTRDYVRMKSLELGYNFGPDFAGKIGAKDIRFSISGTNLITITSFPFDPEITQGGVNADDVRSGNGAALNNGQAYPMLKTITGSFRITF